MKKMVIIGSTAILGFTMLGGVQGSTTQKNDHSNKLVEKVNNFSTKILSPTLVDAAEQQLVSQDAIRIDFAKEYLFVTSDGKLSITHGAVTRNIGRVQLIKADGTSQIYENGNWVGLQLHVGDTLKIEVLGTWGTVRNPGVQWVGPTTIDKTKIYSFTFNSANQTSAAVSTIDNQVPRDAIRVDFSHEYLYVTSDGKLEVTSLSVAKNIGRVRLIKADGTIQNYDNLGSWVGLQLHIGDTLKVEVKGTWGTVRSPGVQWKGPETIDRNKVYVFTFNSVNQTSAAVSTIEQQSARDALRIDFSHKYLYVTSDGKLEAENQSVVKNIGRVQLIKADGTSQIYENGNWLGLQLHVGDTLKVEVEGTWGTVKSPGVRWEGPTTIDKNKIYAFTFNSANQTSAAVSTIDNQAPRDAIRIDFAKQYLYVTPDGRLATSNNSVIRNVDRVRLIKPNGSIQDFSNGSWVGLQLHIGDTLQIGFNGTWGTVRSPGVEWTGPTKINKNRNYRFSIDSSTRTTAQLINY